APIEAAMPELAQRIGRANLSTPALRRAINANFRLGQPASAEALARLAARANVADEMRIEALRCLESWAQPSGRDRTTGLWRPLGPRDAQVAAAALRPVLGGVFGGSDKVRQAATQTTSKLGIKEVGPELAALVADRKQPAQVRAEA